MKAILRGFEMASGLTVDFLTSSWIGVNVDGGFMEMACNFFNCKKDWLLLKYLRLPVPR